MNTIKRFILCIFAVLMVFGAYGCSKEEEIGSLGNNNGWVGEAVMIGSGKTLFDLEVVDTNNNISKFKVATDKKTVGEALAELNFIEIERHGHGTHITKVNGIEANESEQAYWEFYIDGKVSSNSVYETEILKYKVYGFKIKK